MHPIIDLCKRFVKDKTKKNKDIRIFFNKKGLSSDDSPLTLVEMRRVELLSVNAAP